MDNSKPEYVEYKKEGKTEEQKIILAIRSLDFRYRILMVIMYLMVFLFIFVIYRIYQIFQIIN